MTKNINVEIGSGNINLKMVDPRGTFLTAVQKVTGCKDGCVIAHRLGGTAIVQGFKQNGIIPSKWRSLLAGFKKGPGIIKRFEEEFLDFQRNNEAILREGEICEGVRGGAMVIPKNQVPLVLALVRIYARSDMKIAEVLNVEMGYIDILYLGKKCLPKTLLRTIIVSLEIPEEPFQKWL